MCSSLYYKSYEGLCFKYIKNKIDNNSLKEEHCFTCNDSSKIDTILLDDLVADCEGAEDEATLLALLTFTESFKSAHEQELPCRKGHTKCFNITDICSYELNKFHILIPCRNGGHLENCRDFECNAKYKCRSSYCIPWIYVCNGVWDCPEGDDEQYKLICDGNYQSCKDMCKYKNTKHTCIHLGNVCDGQSDCPYEDDDNLCELKYVQ